MDARDVTVILHGCAWPGGDPAAAWRDWVDGADGRGGEVLESREQLTAAVGAAALVNRAAGLARGAVLLVAEPAVTWDMAAMSRLSAAAAEGLALTPPINGRCRLWAVGRRLFEALGGLDERLWSVGELDDLVARSARTPGLVSLPCSRAGPEPYPLMAAARALLAIRNPLVTAFKTAPPDQLGAVLGEVAARALGAATRAASLDPAAFRFDAPRRSRRDAWPADEAGTLVPLLALDSFLTELPSLLAERARFAGPDRSRDVDWGRERVSGSAGASPPRPRSQAALPRSDSPPRTSVIVVNWNGREHLAACLGSILACDYPDDRLEVVLVDNGSTDGSRELVESAFPRVRLVALDSNRGFTGGNNAGVAASGGDVLVFLNNDMRIDTGAVRALVEALDERHPCAAARVLSWDGRRIDFVRGTVNFEGRGFQEHYAEPYRPELAGEPATFFPNGGAFAVTRAAYDRAGGFDDRFFAYYDDVDLGWRLRLAGFEIAVAHGAVVYHRHGATSRRFPNERKQFLMERNAIWTAMKCYGDRTLTRALGPLLLLAARRIVERTAVHRRGPLARQLAPFSRLCRPWPGRPGSVRVQDVYEAAAGPTDRAGLKPRATREGEADRRAPGHAARVIRRLPLASLAAVGSALDREAGAAGTRERVQRMRAAGDDDVLPWMGRALEYSSSTDTYKRAQDALSDALELKTVFRGRPHLLIVTHEPLHGRLAGPGVRALEMGRALAATLRVTVAAPGQPAIRDQRCAIAPYSFDDHAPLRRLAESADVILVQGFTLARFPFLERTEAPIVADLYCPFTLEHLEQETTALRRLEAAASPSGRARTDAIDAEAAGILGVLNAQLAGADFFVCASERQRDFWLGALHAAGRVNPRTYAADPTGRSLIDVVPFGLPDEDIASAAARARQSKRQGEPPPGLKGTVPGISPGDTVVYWGGSMLDWQDPQTLVRAVGELARERSDIKLFFAGTRHPNPQVKPMAAVDECRAIAASLGLLDRHVFFNDWVPYDDRAAFLLDADLGASTHREHLETRFSFRTRMLDYIWAGLPIVCTRGDHFAALVEARDLGLTVPPGDAAALAAAIRTLADDRALAGRARANLTDLAAGMHWSQVVEPLRRFAERPAFAADRADAVRAYRAHLERSFGLTRRVKRTALALGITERRIEQVKRIGVVQSLMAARNRLAVRRARRQSGRR